MLGLSWLLLCCRPKSVFVLIFVDSALYCVLFIIVILIVIVTGVVTFVSLHAPLKQFNSIRLTLGGGGNKGPCTQWPRTKFDGSYKNNCTAPGELWLRAWSWAKTNCVICRFSSGMGKAAWQNLNAYCTEIMHGSRQNLAVGNFWHGLERKKSGNYCQQNRRSHATQF